MVVTNFDQLFLEEYPKLVALGVSMSGDREVARELAQETMIRAHRRWVEIEQYDEPRAWLRRVMSNLLIDHHRSVTAERAAVRRLEQRPTVVADPFPDDPPWAQLIAPLPAQHRLVATLYYADDLSVAEIATTLDLSTASVKSMLFKIRRNLRKHLAERSQS